MRGEIKLIKNNLKRLSNTQIAEHSLRFFKTGKGEYGEGDKFLGIRVPQLRKLAGDYKKISVNPVRKFTRGFIPRVNSEYFTPCFNTGLSNGIKETLSLLKSKFHEERLLSLFILINLYKISDETDKKEIYNLYLSNTRFINNWDLVDCSAEHIAGAYLRERDRKPLYNLALSKNLWERRIAIMSTFHFIKRNDFTDALRISEILLCDKEDLIHKAVGWMLREIGKRDISAEEKFLQRYYKNMPRTMLRYAIERLPKNEREKYLKGKLWTKYSNPKTT